MRSGTSVAANYRATGRARSRAEFIAKIGTVVEEIDETVFWIELLTEADVVPAAITRCVLNEANELLAIFAAPNGLLVEANEGELLSSGANEPMIR